MRTSHTFARAAGHEPLALPEFKASHGVISQNAGPQDTVAQRAASFRVPVPLAPLVGRERDVLAGRRLLGQPSTRLLTLYGPPGVGKTRLGLELALEMQDEFANGACFVSLAAVNDPGHVAKPTRVHAC